eukprot:COSAG06_NODE_60_length_27159_cov_57.986031_29_plen_65_part_00
MERLRPPAWPPTNPYSGVVSDFAHCEADFRDLQVYTYSSARGKFKSIIHFCADRDLAMLMLARA